MDRQLLFAFTFLLSGLAFSNVDSQPRYFNKDYDQEALTSLLPLEPDAIVNEIENRGVQVIFLALRNPKTELERSKQASSRLQEEWVEYFKENKVIGKYMSPYGFRPEALRATILVTDFSDKWTLIHEYLHYLFEKERLKNDTKLDARSYENQSNVRADFLDAYPKLRNSKFQDLTLLSQATDLFIQYMDLEIEISSRLALEEIAVEKIISDLYQKNSVPHLTQSQYVTAQKYMQKNHQQFAGQLDTYLAIESELRDASQNPTILNSIHDKLSNLKAYLSLLISNRSPASLEVDESVDSICGSYYAVFPAPEPSLQPKCQVKGDTLFWDGAIDGYLLIEIRDYHKNIKHLELNSYGGKVEEVYRISELIRERGISTNVRKGARCASACTLLYQAGAKRTAYPLSRFLYHGARIMSSGIDNWREYCDMKGREACIKNISDHIFSVKKETEDFFSAYLKYDMDPLFIEFYKSQPIDPDWFINGNFTRTRDLILSAAQLVKYNIVQDFDLRESL